MNLFFALLHLSQDFLTKTVKIRQFSQCLHGLFTQLWDAIFYLFEVLVLAKKNNHVVALLMSFLRVLLFTLISYYLLLHLGFCEAYQNCFSATNEITTAFCIKYKVLIKVNRGEVVSFTILVSTKC